MTPYRIAITGIDGCGKSTVIKELMHQQNPAVYQVFSCTNFHDTPNAPFAQLSKEMDTLSQYADQRNDPTIKYASLYLKMTLFGAIETFFTNYFCPKVLFTERHPLVGSLAYGNLYLQMNAQLNLKKHSAWHPRLLKESQIPWTSILHWFELENKRLNRKLDIWDLPDYLIDIQRQETKNLLSSLEDLFRTSLPNKIIHFQISEEIAATRVGQNKRKEIHESKNNLKYIHQAYLKALSRLNELGVTIVYLDVGKKSPQELTKLILEELET